MRWYSIRAPTVPAAPATRITSTALKTAFALGVKSALIVWRAREARQDFALHGPGRARGVNCSRDRSKGRSLKGPTRTVGHPRAGARGGGRATACLSAALLRAK